MLKQTGREFVRSQVRKRDRYRCSDCKLVRTPLKVSRHNRRIRGLRGKIKNLDVHHIKGLCGTNSTGYDRVNQMHLLVTLCHRCHFRRHDHAAYGKYAKTRAV